MARSYAIALVLFCSSAAWAVNDFTGDPNCVAVYRFEDGALTTDSQDAQTLSNTGVTADTINYQEGLAAADFELDDHDHFSRADADLSADFPTKNGTTNYTFSITCWIRPESGTPQWRRTIAAKEDNYQSVRGWKLFLGSLTNEVVLTVQVDPLGSCQVSWPSDAVPEVDHWYFIGATCTVTGGNVVGTMHVWDLEAAQNLGGYADRTFTGSAGVPCLNNRPFTIGAETAQGYGGGGGFDYFFDGRIDELTLWNRVLTFDEMYDIRDGTFGAPTVTARARVLRLVED